MTQILVVWALMCSIFFGGPSIYYLYMRRLSSKPWRFRNDEVYSPTISILVPTYNEAEVIELKLENLSNIRYPENLIEIIVIDSGSTDNTVEKIREYSSRHPEMNIELLKEEKRQGKSKGLNLALKHAKGEVIVVSDADCFWSSDILEKALPYLANLSVGAIVGREVILNRDRSWVTKNEALYRDLTSVIRIGESKFYATIIFEGGFSAYKRAFLEEFDCETGADDTGTALRVIQKNVRTILVPEASFFTAFPTSWKGKITIKTRRASQLVRIWTKCLVLLLRRKLMLPKRIAISEIFLHVFNPLIFVSLVCVTFLMLPQYPFFLLALLFAMLIPKSRNLLLETVQDNVILLSALVSLVLNRSFVIWRKADESRNELTRDLLKSHRLI